MSTKEVIYCDPMKQSILLTNCRLVNKEKAAKNIFSGANKYVCSWVEFEEYEFVVETDKLKKQIHYNPDTKAI